jgi:hypothetical protein
MTVDEKLRVAFGVHVCHECKKGSKEYDLLNKSDAKEQYLLSDGVMAKLSFLEKDNPRHSTWTKMKLYMRGKVRCCMQNTTMCVTLLSRSSSRLCASDMVGWTRWKLNDSVEEAPSLRKRRSEPACFKQASR